MKGKKVRTITGRQVFWALFAFFAAVSAMNVVMVVLGSESWTGLTVESSYEKGLHYNETIRQSERQSALGWRSAFEFRSEGLKKGRLIVTLLDDTGRGIEKLELEGSAVRPTSEGDDRNLSFQALGEGRYASELDLPLSGQWDIIVRAATASEVYRTRYRLNLN